MNLNRASVTVFYVRLLTWVNFHELKCRNMSKKLCENIHSSFYVIFNETVSVTLHLEFSFDTYLFRWVRLNMFTTTLSSNWNTSVNFYQPVLTQQTIWTELRVQKGTKNLIPSDVEQNPYSSIDEFLMKYESPSVKSISHEIRPVVYSLHCKSIYKNLSGDQSEKEFHRYLQKRCSISGTHSWCAHHINSSW